MRRNNRDFVRLFVCRVILFVCRLVCLLVSSVEKIAKNSAPPLRILNVSRITIMRREVYYAYSILKQVDGLSMRA